MNKKIKLGFIGGGINSAVGQTHKIAAEIDSKFEVVCGAFSRNASVNKKTATLYGLSAKNIYNSWIELLKKEKQNIDAIVVLTPTPTHKEIIIQALKNNIPVICEKSLTNNRADGKEIIKAVEDYNGFLVVTYNYTGYPMVREMKNMIEQNNLGQIQQIHIEMPQEGFLRLSTDGKEQIPQEWRLLDNEIPTVSLDLGVHLHNMVYFLTSEKAINVVAKEGNYGYHNGIIDNVSCIAEYSKNIVCNYWYGKTALGQSNGLKVRVFGEKGSLEWFQLHPEEIIYCDNIGNRHKIDKSSSSLKVASLDRYSRFKAGHPAGFIEAFANYYYDIANALTEYKKSGNVDSEFVFFAKDAYDSLKLTYAIHNSNEKKSWVNV